MKPINISIMDVDHFVTSKNLMEVTSTFFQEPTTGNFERNGLFSETIFGELGSPDRVIRHGYIDMHTTIIHPTIFEIIKELKSYYVDILKGFQYAVWNEKTGQFDKADVSDTNADTGYSFFMNKIHLLKWDHSDSESRKTKVNILTKNSSKLKMSKCLVIPAGLRDYREDRGRGSYDVINTSYRKVIELSTTLKGNDTEQPVFDTIRWSVQRAVNETFDRIWALLSNDNGFIQSKYISRSVARATRNVLVATEVSAAENNQGAKLKPDEILLPLYQAMCAFMLPFKHYLSTIFYNPIFSTESDHASLIDPETLGLTYVELSIEERQRFVTSEKLESAIHAFRDQALRHMPAIAYGIDHKKYYLYLIYQKGENVYIGRNFNDMKIRLAEKGIHTNLKREEVRPMTWFEMYYYTCYVTTSGKHATSTRYPVTHHWSIFVGKIHVGSTIGYQKAVVEVLSSDSNNHITFPRWPDKNYASINGLAIHPSQFKVLNADTDGDMLNTIGLFSDEANQAAAAFLSSPRSVLDPSGTPMIGLSTDLCKVTLYNLTRPSKK